MRQGGSELQMLRIGGDEVPVEVRVHARARRISLRVDRANGRVRLTLPRGVSLAEGLRFAARQEDWVAGRLAALPERVPFADGAVVPVLGHAHVIRHRPFARRGVWREAGAIHVSGPAEHLPRRVGDFLKREARAAIAPRARELAARIGRTPGRITLRDTRSRWGSCSARGDLNFSWRLVLAPEEVLHYVVAHEVAHLRHLDHGPRFWALCAELHGPTEAPRAWLRAEGAGLLRYG